MHSTNLTFTRVQILSLYRQILKVADQFPTTSYRNFVREKAKSSFREPRDSHEELIHAIRLASTHLDDLHAQLIGMQSMYKDDRKTDQQIHDEQVKVYRDYEVKRRPDWDIHDDEEHK
jgi:hypothetical protein